MTAEHEPDVPLSFLSPRERKEACEWDLPVHDPFAGTGERLGALCDTLGLTFTGTEIEPEFARDRRVHAGDSAEAGTYLGHHCTHRRAMS
jgi:hypothetical protein